MGDSDDEYSHNRSANNSFNNPMKKNRDKFHRERDDSSSNQNQSNQNSYSNNSRRDWNEERNRGEWKSNRGGSYGNSGGGYPRKYSNQASPGGHHDSSPPPQKRRKDWDTGSTPAGEYSSSSYGSKHGAQFNEPEYPTQPPFLSFKLFLQQQDDNITDEEAIKKYNDYKIEFKKTQINNFFLEHKEEEWFKLRYHPDENYKRRNEQNQNILNRLEVFMDLMNKGWLEDVAAEFDKSKELTRFLDACVIKLEGGTDQDIKKLLDGIDETEEPIEIKEIKEENIEESHENGDENNSNGKRKSQEDSGSESGAYTDSDSDTENKSHKKKKSKSKPQSDQAKQLHKTASIFMRNLAPSVTKQDLENLCKQYDGFKRVALSDPAPERGFYRRGWITFDSNVDVKKICWNLQNIKIKDSNPGAIVNRELTSRIRPVANLFTHHKSVIKNDLKLAMRIVQNMDKRWNLWQDEETLNAQILSEDKENKENEKEETSQEAQAPTSGEEQKSEDVAKKAQEEYAKLEESGFAKLTPQGPMYLSHKFNGANPLLENITDYLVEEANAEEEELLGDEMPTRNGQGKSGSFDIEIDRNYTRVLDRLVLYLRVVHSIDYYNSSEYQQEDSMPNRCGIMFVRPALPSNAASASLKVNQDDINKYLKQFEHKVKPYTEYKDKIDLDMAKKLGIKERKEEIDKFIKTNTQELAPDRWLCPLSGKRFKGPEFIRKHLFYKHMEKIIEVKKEVEYFNNYVFDPKRPQLPEHPSNRPAGQQSGAGASQQAQGGSGQGSYQSGYSGQSGMSYGGSPGAMMGQNMMGQMGFGQMQNRQMGGWSSGYMGDMIQAAGGYAPNFGTPSFGMGATGGFNQGYKKPGYNSQAGFNPRRGNQSREMIQYKDLDAPDDA